MNDDNQRQFEAVELKYLQSWQGVILYEMQRKGATPLCLVLIIYDRKGSLMQRRVTTFRDKASLVTIKPFEILPGQWLYTSSTEYAHMKEMVAIGEMHLREMKASWFVSFIQKLLSWH